jgi:hypothetical protein
MELQPSLNSAPPAFSAMAGPECNKELLSSLGQLVRGLSALFWGLPIALVVCVQTARGDWLRSLGILPPLLATGLLFYGLLLLGNFRKQERIWRRALERVKIFGLVNFGLSPFLYWWNKVPSHPFFNSILGVLFLSGLLFIYCLNPMLCRLTAMLPDETLRQETRIFTSLNRLLILATLLVAVFYCLLARSGSLPPTLSRLLFLLDRIGLWLVLFLILMPVAMTMALIWKIKEVILASVFGGDS